MSLEELDDDEREAGRDTLWAQAMMREIADMERQWEKAALSALCFGANEVSTMSIVLAGQAKAAGLILSLMNRKKED